MFVLGEVCVCGMRLCVHYIWFDHEACRGGRSGAVHGVPCTSSEVPHGWKCSAQSRASVGDPVRQNEMTRVADWPPPRQSTHTHKHGLTTKKVRFKQGIKCAKNSGNFQQKFALASITWTLISHICWRLFEHLSRGSYSLCDSSCDARSDIPSRQKARFCPG